MVYAPKNEETHKEQLTCLLLLPLQIAGAEAEGEKDFEKAFMKRLKFQKQSDWKRYRASVDLLDDTEYAIISGFEYQLGDIRNQNGDTGEDLLRLYGILNAVYLQMSAFKEIAKLLNYPSGGKISETFERLDIYRLRNIAAAHTVDFRYDKEFQERFGIKKSTSFRIIQHCLEKTGSKILAQDENDIRLEFNLLKALTEYEKIATDLLVELIKHSIITLIHKKEDKIGVRKRLDELLPNLRDYSTINKNKRHRSLNSLVN